MSLIELVLNKALADGDFTSAAMQINGSPCTVSVDCSNIAVNDVTLELHQSVDNVNYGLIAESLQTLKAGQLSHQWNIIGLVPGCFIKLVCKKGTATAGTILKLKILTS